MAGNCLIPQFITSTYVTDYDADLTDSWVKQCTPLNAEFISLFNSFLYSEILTSSLLASKSPCRPIPLHTTYIGLVDD